MRDPNRIPLVLGAIQRAWEECPDLRLGQLIANVAGRGAIVFGIEDDHLVRLLCQRDGMTEQEREFVENEPARRSDGMRKSMTLTSEAAMRLLAQRADSDHG